MLVAPGLRDGPPVGGVSAQSDSGEADPPDALEHTLRTFDADRVVKVHAHPRGERRYREGIDLRKIG